MEIDSNKMYIVTASVVLGVLTVLTIVGNVFVIAAVLTERNLRTTGNYLVLSLAVADLMVACLVMPLGAFSEIAQQWTLGTFLCDIWTSADVLCCTASILHLLAIALDRYWAVTYVDYIHKRTPQRIGVMIFTVWTVAAILAIAPLVGWKDANFNTRVEQEKRCLISQDIGYQVFATISTFYAPLIFILLLYWKIYQVARKRIRHKPGKTVTPVSEANPKIIDLRNEKSLTGKRRLLVPAKTSRADKGKSAGNKTTSGNCGGGGKFSEEYNGQQRFPVTAIGGGNVGRLNKAAAIMGINNSAVSLTEENNNNSNGTNRNELANYFAVYSNEVNQMGPQSNGGNRTNTCQSIVTLDASQLVATVMERVERNGAHNAEYDRVAPDRNGPALEPTCATANNISTDPCLDQRHNSLASEHFDRATAPANGSNDCNELVLTCSTNYYQQRPCSSDSPSKRTLATTRPLPSGPSSATSSPMVTTVHRHLPTHHMITVDSYHTTSSPASTSSNYHLHPQTHNQSRTKTIKESIESKRERKAAKILAIITGIFVMCWLPFFVVALLMPLCKVCEPSKLVFSIFLWLGYLNSLLNPIIYTIFSPDFRNGFRRILCGRKR